MGCSHLVTRSGRQGANSWGLHPINLRAPAPLLLVPNPLMLLLLCCLGQVSRTILQSLLMKLTALAMPYMPVARNSFLWQRCVDTGCRMDVASKHTCDTDRQVQRGCRAAAGMIIQGAGSGSCLLLVTVLQTAPAADALAAALLAVGSFTAPSNTRH
jgi:hypothetical protein